MPNFIFKIVLELYNDRIAYSRSGVFLIKSRHSRLGDALQFSKRLRSRYLVCSPRPRETAEVTSRRRPPQGCPSTGQCQTRTSTALSLCHRYTHWHTGTPGATGARKRLRAPPLPKTHLFSESSLSVSCTDRGSAVHKSSLIYSHNSCFHCL